MSLHVMFYDDLHGKVSRVHLRGLTDEQADKKFKEMKLQILYDKKGNGIVNERFYSFPHLGN